MDWHEIFIPVENLTMNALKLFLYASILLACSCNKENGNNLYQQAHDQNAMMKLMHNMMDSMKMMQMTNDPDMDFAVMMKMHHTGAIMMAQKEKNEGEDGTLKQMAQTIIDEQSQEIQELNNYLANNTTPNNNDTGSTAMSMKMMEEMGRQADLQVINGNTDQDFASLMIIHHQSAVDMAHHYLVVGNEPDLKAMAKTMIESQQMEIEKIQEWLLPYIKK